MASLPYMPLYVADYLADTTHLTVTEHGAYLLLIMSLWRNETLPDDDKILARHARCTSGQWARMRPVLIPFFEVADGVLWHGRVRHDLTATRVAVERQAQRSSNGGKATALKYKRSKPPAVAPTARHLESDTDSEANASERAPKRRSRRCPADWMPSQATIDKLKAEGVGEFNRPSALANFKDHEFKDPRSDWDAAYRKWIRSDAERAERNGHRLNGHDERKQAAMAVLAEPGDDQREGQLALIDGRGHTVPAPDAGGHYQRQPARR